jgi:hypothetical protein
MFRILCRVISEAHVLCPRFIDLLKPTGHCMYRTVVTVCTAQWSLYVPHSCHCMYRTVVTVCTAQWSLYVPRDSSFSNSTFCPHTVFMCFVWISEQTAIISLYSINWLVFVTDGVYLLRGTGWILMYNSRLILVLKGWSMWNFTCSRRLSWISAARLPSSGVQSCYCLVSYSAAEHVRFNNVKNIDRVVNNFIC